MPWPHVAEVAILVFVAYLVGCVAGFLLRLALSQQEDDAAPERHRELTSTQQFAAIAGLKPTPVQRLAANLEAASIRRPAPPQPPVFTTIVETVVAPRHRTATEPVAPPAPEPLILMAVERSAGAALPSPIAEPQGIANRSQAKAVTHTGFGKPTALPAPRNRVKDNLRLIKGIGPRIERGLNELGVFHFDQIAAWDRKTIVWVENHFSFKGRVERERWVAQASELSVGPARAPRSLRA